MVSTIIRVIASQDLQEIAVKLVDIVSHIFFSYFWFLSIFVIWVRTDHFLCDIATIVLQLLFSFVLFFLKFFFRPFFAYNHGICYCYAPINILI